MKGLPISGESLKYPDPEVLLIDLQPSALATLRDSGYNVVAGTFGAPYFRKGPGFFPVLGNAELPGLTEQDIVFVDLSPIEASLAVEEPVRSLDWGWWGDATGGVVDPRPPTMKTVRRYFDRILEHGGLVVLLASLEQSRQYLWARWQPSGLDSDGKDAVSLSNWCLLTTCDYLATTHDPGSEVLVVRGETPLHRIISDFRGKLSFDCTIRPLSGLGPTWETLATNKYGSAVAGVVTPRNGHGRVLILPRVGDQEDFMRPFFQNVLPELVPHLFPHHVAHRWFDTPEYELPSVVQLQHEIVRVDREAEIKKTELIQAIEAERQRMGFQHDLLRATGDELVSAVRRALELIGFERVVDSDSELPPGARKREDLQIHDQSPVLLVEIKGVAGLPSEAEAIQVWKYLSPWMRDWKRTDLHGLAIVNHQRHLPALDRQAEPFPKDVLTNASEHHFGLMTTWDLFRLVRSFLKLGWNPDHVKPLFYRSGRIHAVPVHYEPVGVVENYWEKQGALGINVTDNSICRGDTLCYQTTVEYVEERIDSLQVDRTPADVVHRGQFAGVKTAITKEQVRKRSPVFRVKR